MSSQKISAHLLKIMTTVDKKGMLIVQNKVRYKLVK